MVGETGFEPATPGPEGAQAELPSLRIGGSLRFRLEALEGYLARLDGVPMSNSA